MSCASLVAAGLRVDGVPVDRNAAAAVSKYFAAVALSAASEERKSMSRVPLCTFIGSSLRPGSSQACEPRVPLATFYKRLRCVNCMVSSAAANTGGRVRTARGPEVAGSRRGGVRSAGLVAAVLAVFAQPVRRHESEKRDRYEALPADGAAGLNNGSKNLWIEQQGRRACRPFDDRASLRSSARKHGGHDADRGKQDEDAGGRKAGEDIAELPRQPVIKTDAKEHEGGQRRQNYDCGPCQEGKGDSRPRLDSKGGCARPAFQHGERAIWLRASIFSAARSLRAENLARQSAPAWRRAAA